MPSLYDHIAYARGPAPKTEAEQARDAMAAEIRRTTAASRLATSEVHALMDRLVALGWTPPAKAVP